MTLWHFFFCLWQETKPPADADQSEFTYHWPSSSFPQLPPPSSLQILQIFKYDYIVCWLASGISSRKCSKRLYIVPMVTGHFKGLSKKGGHTLQRMQTLKWDSPCVAMIPISGSSFKRRWCLDLSDVQLDSERKSSVSLWWLYSQLVAVVVTKLIQNVVSAAPLLLSKVTNST